MVGSHDVDHPACWEPVPGGPSRGTGRQPVREPLRALLQQTRTRGGVNSAVDPATAAHPAVGSVDNRVHPLLGDVALHDRDLDACTHDVSIFSTARSRAAWRSSDERYERRTASAIVVPPS